LATNVIHPYGLPPPPEWAERQSIPAVEYQEWLAMKPGDQRKRPKYGQLAGVYEDLGIHLKSKLEAQTLRLLRFLGYELWTDKESPPPAVGKHVAYEWRKYRLEYKRGKEGERALWYLPDWHLWDDGHLAIWESKGLLDARSKRLLRLMEQQVMHVELITAEELEARRTVALYEARRRGERVLDIPHWNDGPKEGAR
jgi:hypothetical protein